MEPGFPRELSAFARRARRTASFSTDFTTSVRSLHVQGAAIVIRTVALGMVCLAGLGAIAVAAKKSTPPPPPRPEVVMPAVSINKADRLPTIINQNDTQPDAEKLAIAYVPSSDQNESSPPRSASQETARARDSDIAQRPSRERHHARAKTERRRSIAKPKVRPADPPPAQVSELKECRSDGLRPLMRQLNLSPPCD